MKEAEEYFEKHVIWDGPDITNSIEMMEGFTASQLKELKEQNAKLQNQLNFIVDMNGIEILEETNKTEKTK